MPKIGYMPASVHQVDIQKAKLAAVGCEVIRSETISSAFRDDRYELATITEFLREGDEFIVLRLDHLGLSIRDVLNLVAELDAKGASLRILEPDVTTAGDMDSIVIKVLDMVHGKPMTPSELDFVQKSLKSTPKKIPLAATSSRACSRRKMIHRKSPIPCHRFRWNLDHPQTRHTKIYNNQLFNYPIYLPNSAGPKIRATVQPHFLNLTLCIE